MATDVDFTAREWGVISTFHGGFPAVGRAFESAVAAMGDRGVDLDADQLFETVPRFDRDWKIRRIDVVENHHAMGDTENRTTVGEIPVDIAADVVTPSSVWTALRSGTTNTQQVMEDVFGKGLATGGDGP